MKFLVLLALLGCAAAQQAPRTIIDTLGELGETSILELIELAGLTDALNGDGPFTAFVPKQEVLDNIPQEILDEITSDPDTLAKGLLYHVADGLFTSEDGVNEGQLPTLQGTPLRLNIYDVDGATVATVAGVPIDLENIDIDAGNGNINLLNGIILDVPDNDALGTVQAIPADTGFTFEALLYAIESLGIAGDIAALEDITVIVPIDSETFTTSDIDELLADPDALAAIINNHVASGTLYSAGVGAGKKEVVTNSGNTIVIAYTEELGCIIEDVDGNQIGDLLAGDIPTLQGVLHIIDVPITL